MFYPTKPGSAALYKRVSDKQVNASLLPVDKRLGTIMSQERPQFEEIKLLKRTSNILIKDC